MSIIFQLFSAEDLKQLKQDQWEALRRVVSQAVGNSQDPFLKASQTIAIHVQQRLLGSQQDRHYPVPPPQTPPSDRVVIDQNDIDNIPQGAVGVLKKRAREVFEQLTGRQLSGQFGSHASPNPTIEQLLDQLLGAEDTRILGAERYAILTSALTCELANFKTYEALRGVKEKAEEAFMRFMEENGKGKQRPKGPDLLYSPFHPLSPLHSYPSRPDS